MFLVQTKFDSSVYNGIESIEANFYIALNISDYVKKKKKIERVVSFPHVSVNRLVSGNCR